MSFKTDWLPALLLLCAAPTVGTLPAQSAAGGMVGGYQNTDAKAPAVALATRFAIQTQRAKMKNDLKLVVVQRAETQIVAGTNYRLAMLTKTGGKVEEVTAVVYLDLEQKFSLTSWTKADAVKP